ncbi:MAG: DegV family protein [Bacilli bacterium]|nr:DegV family protein [Bacilli bacterium]
MHSFAILTDNACGFTHEIASKYGIDGMFVGYVTEPDGKTHKADVDWENTTPDEYFKSMSDKKHLYKTAACGPDDMCVEIKKHVEAGLPVLIITLSGALSGTYNFASKARELVLKEFPEAKIEIVDSLRYGTSLGSLCVYAAKLREEGKTFEETVKWVEENRNCFHESGPMDDLFFLARTGRISSAKAFFGNLVGVKPMGDFNGKGLSEVMAKAKGLRKAFEVGTEYIKRTIVNPQDQTIFVSQSLREKEVAVYVEMIRKEINPKEIVVIPVDQSSGANIGPGLMCAFYYGKMISEGLAEEKAIMTELLAK